LTLNLDLPVELIDIEALQGDDARRQVVEDETEAVRLVNIDKLGWQ
jgi:hypothetical protein